VLSRVRRARVWPSSSDRCQARRPDRPVLALLGDGAMHNTVARLCTAARHSVPVTFVVANNTEYGALRRFAQLLGTPDPRYPRTAGIDSVSIARGDGIPG
jgi:benzoylformate decarboxylase